MSPENPSTSRSDPLEPETRRDGFAPLSGTSSFVTAAEAPDRSFEDPSVSTGEPPDCDELSESSFDDTPAGASPASDRSPSRARLAASAGAPESRPSDRVSLDFASVIRFRVPPFQVEYQPRDE
jgi:hypothetical protein